MANEKIFQFDFYKLNQLLVFFIIYLFRKKWFRWFS